MLPILYLKIKLSSPLHPITSVTVFKTTTKTKPNRRWVRRNVYKRKQTLFNTANATDISLSSHILTDPQTQLLSHDLNFCPTPHHINHIELSEDIHRFCRRLRLAEFFYDEENTTPINHFLHFVRSRIPLLLVLVDIQL
ncbi:flagellar protein flil [Plakobranchus ocellatus]|uniref:Flagellar protein flil n=1 Tax=Plakobranchus ocellatus TaxID=259542 RepID=A0AAV4AIE0_9GAST|nr:flagellar protein flil [Plakobranchus ocellatus]